MADDYQKILTDCFLSGVSACQPENCLPPFLKYIDVDNKLVVLGAGKAAAQMAAVVHRHFPDKCSGVVVTRYGHAKGAETGAIKVLEASHPVPDQNSMLAAQALLQEAKHVGGDAHVMCLISGGGSALTALPAKGISFEDKMAIHKFLLHSGAAIDEVNCVRKHLSGIKGGRLADAVQGKHLTTYVISDVVGDDPAMIASGPTVLDDTTPQQAIEVLEKYNWRPVISVEKHLTQQSSAPVLKKQQQSDVHVIASSRTMLEAALQKAGSLGWDAQIFADDEVGDAASVARKHAEIALAVKNEGKRCILLSGGELTVQVGHSLGRGGPNQEYLLALADSLKGAKGIGALACDSDGIDGSEDNAGAFISETTLLRAKQLGLSVRNTLQAHDSYSFFEKLGDLIVTGPTNTNVNDFRAIVVDP